MQQYMCKIPFTIWQVCLCFLFFSSASLEAQFQIQPPTITVERGIGNSRYGVLYYDLLFVRIDTMSMRGPGFQYILDIAFDSTFQHPLPGWKNQELPDNYIRSDRLIVREKIGFIQGLYPDTRYFVRCKVFYTNPRTLQKDSSDYSRIASITTPSSPSGVCVLPAVQRDSSTAILRWVAYPNLQRYRLRIVNWSASFNSSCSEWSSLDSSFVPREYQGEGKLIIGTSDTVLGLRPGIQYRFEVRGDTGERQKNTLPLPAIVFNPPTVVGGHTSAERNLFCAGRKFVMLPNQALHPEPISYYEAPWRSTRATYYTMSDSNVIQVQRNHIALRTMYQRMLARLDSMKNIGIPIDTAYIAFEGMHGVRPDVPAFDLPGLTCYFARIVSVFTLRRPDIRVTQFAHQGNGLPPFSWDADYFRVVFPTITSVGHQMAETKSRIILSTAPNPATDELQIHYSTSSPSCIGIEVFSAFGQKVFSLLQEPTQGGTHSLTIPVREWASGVYLLRCILSDTQGKNTTVTQKITVFH